MRLNGLWKLLGEAVEDGGKDADPVARLSEVRRAVGAEVDAATAARDAADDALTSAIYALSEGEADAGEKVGRARIAQESARARVEEAERLAGKLDVEIIAANERAAAQSLAWRRGEAAAMLARREALAATLQAQLEQAAATFSEMETLRERAIGTFPEARERTRHMPEGWRIDGALLDGINQHLLIGTDGRFGDPRAYGLSTAPELRRKLRPLAEIVAAVHRQFLGAPTPSSTPVKEATHGHATI